MRFDFIVGEVARVKRQYDESEPSRLARAMNIMVREDHIGECKGFYLCQNRIKCITLNAKLSKDWRRLILAHEIGHAVLGHHKDGLISRFDERSVWSYTNVFEREANLFAAELLLDDEYVLAAIEDYNDFFKVARFLRVPQELLAIKYELLKDKGHDTLKTPVIARSNFLK